jgi:hypothetical protein
MIGRVNLWIGCGVLLAASLNASSAFAQNGARYPATGSNGSLGFYGFGYYDYSFQQPHVPYYALYPPVYYSHPVPRTYGYSPFAYPPGVLTPEVDMNPGAALYRNPFVPPRTEPKPASDKTASVGKTYRNPFLQQARAAASLSVVGRDQQ